MKHLFYTVLFFAICGQALAQTNSAIADSSVYLVQTNDGNEYTGILISDNGNEIILKTKNIGEIKILKSNMESMQLVSASEIKGDQIWTHTAQDARYFFAPNGYGLRKGEGYYQNTFLFFNQVSYGFTNNFTMGLGMIPLFLFAGAPTPVWLTPKVQFPLIKDKLNIGGGALIGTILGLDTEEGGSNSFGIAYGTITAGSRNSNISFGLGYGFAGGEWGNYPSINFSGMVRISERWYLVTENYLFDGGTSSAGVFSGGARCMFKKCSIDFAVLEVGADGTYYPVPWLSFAVPIGHAK